MSALFLDDVENDLHRFPPGLLGRPAGQGFGDRIQVFDSAARIGRNDTIADAMKSNLGALLLVKQRFLGSLAIGDVYSTPARLSPLMSKDFLEKCTLPFLVLPFIAASARLRFVAVSTASSGKDLIAFQ